MDLMDAVRKVRSARRHAIADAILEGSHKRVLEEIVKQQLSDADVLAIQKVLDVSLPPLRARVRELAGHSGHRVSEKEHEAIAKIQAEMQRVVWALPCLQKGN